MEKILIYDVAAEYGGALTVLNDFYRRALADGENETYFVVSKADLESDRHVHIIKLPWVKKSWFHRLYCDNVYMPRLIKELKPSKILSLQNLGLKGCAVYQAVYVHNVIPFADYGFNILGEPYLWIYKNIIGRMICRSLKRVDEVIVQNEWMRDVVAVKCGIPKKRISIDRVAVRAGPEKGRIAADKAVFFYPAQAFCFKNHKVVIDACRKLAGGGNAFEIVFTLDRHEKGLAKRYAKQVEKHQLPIRFVGFLNQEEMAEYYRRSILLFPSCLETVGLPLLEAKAYGADIIAADCEYARNTLAEYERVQYFGKNDSAGLADIIMEKIKGNESVVMDHRRVSASDRVCKSDTKS